MRSMLEGSTSTMTSLDAVTGPWDSSRRSPRCVIFRVPTACMHIALWIWTRARGRHDQWARAICVKS